MTPRHGHILAPLYSDKMIDLLSISQEPVAVVVESVFPAMKVVLQIHLLLDPCSLYSMHNLLEIK